MRQFPRHPRPLRRRGFHQVLKMTGRRNARDAGGLTAIPATSAAARGSPWPVGVW